MAGTIEARTMSRAVYRVGWHMARWKRYYDAHGHAPPLCGHTRTRRRSARRGQLRMFREVNRG